MKYYIGIDIGGMSVKGAVVDESGKIVAKATVNTDTALGYKKVIADIYSLCEKVILLAGMTKDDISAVGMGCPGSIWSEKGIVSYSNNLYWENVPLIKEFQAYWNIPSFVGNDANLAALGEVIFGSAKGHKNAVFVTLGTGVGTGIVIEGKLLEGEKGAGAEGGHLMLKFNGEKCTCGRRGCWEAYASATALIRDTKRAMAKNPESLLNTIAKEEGEVTAKTPFDAARQGDKVALRVVRLYAKYVACGIIDMANLFRPDVALIGGGVSNAGDFLIKMVQRTVSRYAYGGHRNPKISVVRAALGNDAGILGGVALAINNGF